MLGFFARFKASVHFSVPVPTLLFSSTKRFASGKVLADRNIAVVLKNPVALADLLEAVWSHKVEVIDTEVHVRRTIPSVNNDQAAAMTFDGFARLKDPLKSSSSTVAVDFVRSILEVQKRPKNYVSARARMHAVVKDHFEFVNILNSEVTIKGQTQTQTQYAAFEKMSPVQVITICGFAPVCLDLVSFTAAALSANYSQSEIDAIVKAKTQQGKIWYEVDNLHRDNENIIFIKIRPDIHNSDGTTSKAIGKKEMKVVPATIPKAVEVIRPQLAASLDGVGNVPSCMVDYLSGNLSWTFVYIPIIKINVSSSPSRLRSWADFLTSETIKNVPGLSADSLFSSLFLEMSTLPVHYRGWAAEFDEVIMAKEVEKTAKEAALAATEVEKKAKEAALAATEVEKKAKDAALAATEVEKTAKEAALAATEVETKAKEAALAEVGRLKKLVMMEVQRT
jgi:hypothetical protein